MVINGAKLGKLLMDADIITKKQLAEAIEKQSNGDDRKLGEILVELGHVTVADLTEVVMAQAGKAQSESEKAKRDRLLQKQISKSKSKPKLKVEPPIATKIIARPKELSEEAVLSTKFTLSVQTMVAAATGIASLVGMWYMLQADIQEAKELPRIDNIYEQEYPSKAPGYNWPSSYEQYKDQVGTLQEDMDEVLDRLDELEQKVTDLRIKIAKKKDK
jgi:hypothetical protein